MLDTVDTVVFDILGTLVDDTAGLRTAYLDRPGGDPPTADDRFDLHLGAQSELA